MFPILRGRPQSGLRDLKDKHSPMRNYLKRRLDLVGLFGLAGITLVLGGLKALGLHPLRLMHARRLPTVRRRVVLFIPSLGLGGAQRQLVCVLKHLDRTQWDPELVTLDVPDKFFEPEIRALAVPITYLNSGPDYWMVVVIWRLFRHLSARPCHVLHSWMHYAAAFGAIAGGLAGTPTIIGSLRGQRPSRLPWSNSRWQRGIDLLTVPLNTFLIANAQAVREDNRRWACIPDRKLLTIYNGIDQDEAAALDDSRRNKLKAELNLPMNAPLVGIVGRLYPEKDHAAFLQAALLISRARPDARFLIVGEGRLRRWIEEEIQRLGLAPRTHLLGERRDAQAIIQLLDVLVLTSISEGLPNVLLEAGVAGTPVVTTAAGGAPEVVVDRETGFVVPCGDAEAMAQKVLALLGDPALRKRFVQAARERTRKVFSARQAATAIQDCYDRGGASRGGKPGAERPLRICFISTFVYGMLRPSSKLPFGGAEVQIGSLARELSCDSRFAVSVLTGDGARSGREQKGRLAIVLDPFFGRFAPIARQVRLLDSFPSRVAAGVRTFVRGAYACRQRAFGLPLLRGLVQRYRDVRAFLTWCRILSAAGADIYVMRCAWVQVGYAQLACALLRRKFVYMVAHDSDISGEYTRSFGAGGTLYEGGLRRADAVVCQHADQVAVVRSRYHRDARLIRSLCPYPVNPRVGAERHTILWMARVDSWKRPELFLDLAAHFPEHAFVLVGPPSQIEPDNLPQLLDRAKGIPNLRVLAGVPFDDTPALFEAAMVFVNTSSAEGFPNTFLQAAASGTPVVSWAVNPEGVLERYGMGYCADQDWTRFLGYLHLLCRDEALRRRLGENGRRYVQQMHDPGAITREYAELFWNLRNRSSESRAEAASVTR
jgi:glycosyltransferase involved in cell wall biosynthesis